MATEEAEVAVPTLTLRDFIQVLRRRKTVALLTLFGVMSLATVSTLMAKAQYVSNARMMLEEQANAPVSSDLGGIFNSQAGMAIASQVELISSPLILDQVYAASEVPPGAVDLSVSRVEGTNVIQITGTANSPEVAQKFVAAVPEIYQSNRRTESAREVKSELDFAQENLAQENQKLTDTESAIVAFKNSSGLINPDAEVSAAIDRAASRKTELNNARADISSLRAQIAALQSELDELAPTVTTPTIVTNPQIELLNNQLAALQTERKQQKFFYKDNADPIRQIDLKITALKAQIANTPPTITNNSNTTNPDVAAQSSRIVGLNADLSAKEAAAQILVAQSARLDAGLERFSDIQRKYTQLQRDFDATQTAVKQGKEKVRVLTVRFKALEAAGAPITVLLKGTPGVKIAPNPGRNLILALFVGALLACVAAFVQDSLDDRIRDEEEARQMLGAPVLGYFPLLPTSDERQILDMNNPNRLLLETFRALRSNVQFALVNSGGSGAGKTVQVTSTVPNEGKSYIASNLAITMALDGRRVIFVDADLHRPTGHERFGASRQPGLTNVLVGQATVKNSLQSVGFDNLQLLSAGALPPNPAELLNSVAMGQVIKELENMADIIIFDTPPILATSDSQLLSSKMDGVIFVMQMGSVARSGTQRAFDLLKQAHANVIGVVFNKVDQGKTSTAYGEYAGHYALDVDVPVEDQLTVTSTETPVRQLSAAKNGSSNGSRGAANGENGLKSNPSETADDSPTVFDKAISSDKNPR